MSKKKKIEEEREMISKERLGLNNNFKNNNNFIYIRDDSSLDNNEDNNNKEIINEIGSLKKDINDIKNKYSLENSELKEIIHKINRNVPIYQTYNDNNNNSIPLRGNNNIKFVIR